MKTTPRKLTDNVLFALKNHPVVFLNGPRQAGKSTLVQHLNKKDFPAGYVSFDNATQMAAAASSPESFLKSRKGAMIIDEVQIVPEIFRALKLVVDEIRLKDKKNSNGRFLLTGSANIMALPKLSDPLVGRMSVKTLYPFSGCEILGGKGDFLQRLFAMDFEASTKKATLNEVIARATFPEISGVDVAERVEWFDSYLTTILQRDVRLLSEIEKIAMLPNLLRVLASRAGKLMNDAEISRDLGLNPVTSKAYRGILQAMFLQFDVEPWYRNIGKRLVKSPKGFLVDTLLLCHLLDLRLEDMRERKPELYGHVLENFVATELTKLLSFSNVRAKLLHFRTSDDKEVDFVLERPDGTLAGIEVKTADRVDGGDFKGMRVLQQMANDDFFCGVVLYGGRDIVPFGDKLFAVPISSLWG
jgi:predicted AAA+ superfamily ATPase